MPAKVFEEFVEANKAHAATYDKAGLGLPPGRKVTVVTCIDARVDPAKALGLQEGDAHVVRNAGGLASQDIRSIVLSQQLGGTDVLVIMQHTGCGMLTFTNDVVYGMLEPKFGPEIRTVEFLPFSDLKASVKSEIAKLRTSPFIPKTIPIYGTIYHLETGLLELVDASE